MDNLPTIKCKITFLTEEEGGRKIGFPSETLSNDWYRPHFVVGDVSQREAVIDENNYLLEEYLGVSFNVSPEKVKQGEEFVAEIKLMYYPTVSYANLKSGVTFTIREGAKIVGFGTVL